jgi:hypothetical protein
MVQYSRPSSTPHDLRVGRTHRLRNSKPRQHSSSDAREVDLGDYSYDFKLGSSDTSITVVCAQGFAQYATQLHLTADDADVTASGWFPPNCDPVADGTLTGSVLAANSVVREHAIAVVFHLDVYRAVSVQLRRQQRVSRLGRLRSEPAVAASAFERRNRCTASCRRR